jgi:outer membrane protein assembly factor BamB
VDHIALKYTQKNMSQSSFVPRAIVFCILSAFFSLPVLAGEGWPMHGQGIENNAHGKTKINKKNIHKVTLKSIYNIDVTTAGGKTRAENAIGSGIAVTKKGIAYVPTTDGRIHALDLRSVDGVNPDGTLIPRVLDIYDLVADPRYTGIDDQDGDDIVVNRIHPTLSGKNIFAANYNLFLGFDSGGFSNDLMGLPMLTNGFAFKSQGAILVSINKDTGDLNWKTIIDDNPHSMITNNPTVHNGVVYAALSSEMSGSLGLLPFSYALSGRDPFLGLGLPESKSGLLYRNALVALDEKTGEILWKTFVMPDQDYRSYSDILAASGIDLWNGASSWGGGNFPIDKKRGLIFITTGESYSSPLEADACEAARLLVPGANPFSDECIDIDQDGNPIVGPIHSTPSSTAGASASSHPLMDSVIALDIKTGEIKWARRLQGFDVWNLACIGFVLGTIGANGDIACPPYLRTNFGLNFFAKDLDLAEQPMLVRSVKMNSRKSSGKSKSKGKGKSKSKNRGNKKRDLLLVTGKSANVWALDPGTGETVWDSLAAFGPGSLFGGGIVWGSATDGKRIYITSTTSDLNKADLGDPALGVVPGSCPDDAFDLVTGDLNGGIYGALDLATGDIAWQRCLTAALVDSTTGEPVLDNGNEIMISGFNEGPVSVAGGVVYVPGPTTAYGFTLPTTSLRTQVIALDADTGALLRRFPFNADGEPSATLLRFTRTAITDKRIIMGNGLKDNFDSPLSRRVVVYELEN